MSSEKSITIALETAVAGGSLSVWERNVEIDFWVGTAVVSKAEDVLAGLSELLRKNNLTRRRVEAVAVSTEAGSATGLKIGAATAQGLAKALGCRVIYVSLWDALAKAIRSAPSMQSAAFDIYLPGGKNTVCRRKFIGEAFAADSQIIDAKRLSFESAAQTNPHHCLFVHPTIYRAFPQNADSRESELNSLEENMSHYIGKTIPQRTIASDNGPSVDIIRS